uniref:Uncharacterized protein n=1 Tax=Panagrolaimus sp. PS1159 TaxID=55785 RepID=A0AC35FWY0_9BILA
MKTVLIVFVLGVFVTQMVNAKRLPHFDPESEESHEASHSAETELAEIQRDLIALEKRFLELESEESHENPHSAENELAEIQHDLTALEKRFLELGLHEEDKPVNKMSRREKEINKKSLGDIVKWFGKNVIG